MGRIRISSKDLYAGTSNEVSGLAYLGGACLDEYKYLIAEDSGSSAIVSVSYEIQNNFTFKTFHLTFISIGLSQLLAHEIGHM